MPVEVVDCSIQYQRKFLTEGTFLHEQLWSALLELKRNVFGICWSRLCLENNSRVVLGEDVKTHVNFGTCWEGFDPSFFHRWELGLVEMSGQHLAVWPKCVTRADAPDIVRIK